MFTYAASAPAAVASPSLFEEISRSPFALSNSTIGSTDSVVLVATTVSTVTGSTVSSRVFRGLGLPGLSGSVSVFWPDVQLWFAPSCSLVENGMTGV